MRFHVYSIHKIRTFFITLRIKILTNYLIDIKLKCRLIEFVNGESSIPYYKASMTYIKKKHQKTHHYKS